MHRLLSCLALAVVVDPAHACLNDVELPAHEREFRSQYRGPAATPPSHPSEPPGRPSNSLLIGAGATLLAGGLALALAGRRTGS